MTSNMIAPTILTPKLANLPTIGNNYNELDIVGNTIGKYFDYKRDSAIIKAKRDELKYQAEIALKQIDARLTETLDINDKNFKSEMYRLNAIAKELKSNQKDKRQIIKEISNLMQMLLDPNIDRETKEMIPGFLDDFKKMLEQTNANSNLKLNMMTSYNPSEKQIEG